MNNPIVAALFPRTDIVHVTPVMAKEWLNRNTHNRALRSSKVAEFARDIEAGNWAMNGETIKFDINGVLLDGQHRLSAIVKADTSVDLLIVTGLDPATQHTMDAGAKRTTADAFKLKDEKHTALLAAIVRRVWAWERGDHKLSMNLAPTITEAQDFLNANPALRRSAEIASRVRNQFKYAPASTTGVAHFLFNRISPDDTAWFFTRLADGAELSAGHPILTLRKRLLSDSEGARKVSDHSQLATLIRAWNAMRAGQKPTHFKPIATQDAPMPMPK
ncbi:hypothetical protein [Streptomyces sp. BK340]|uniref:hypothetical protein n=1 Tax=Streptomyces sp. BK340 TaxID=2572903 RepID=UPI0011AA5A8C|nr:hypothetical protein [Streptomyces sp. BK340]TVZ96474.1 hypothetical protein FB157_103385 [Streptomyces sp. BK340]